jgi:hypothetical protein
MASNQPVSAIRVIPSDSINIPKPGSVVGGNSSTNGTTLTDATALFKSNFISGGDVVYVGSEIHEILSVDSDTVITLKTAVVAAAPYAYKIFKGNGGDLKQGYDGYSLFVGTTGDVVVLTPGAGQDEVTLVNIANASFIPLQVIRVLNTGTTATDIIALD